MSCQFVAHLLLTLAGIGVEIFLFLIVGGILRLWFFGEACGLQFGDGLEGKGCQALALGLVALDGDKLLCINLFLPTESICTAIGDLDAGLGGIRE